MSVQLGLLLFWLAMTIVGCVIWRSGDKVGGPSLARLGAINSVGAAGLWLNHLGYLWAGGTLVAANLGLWARVIWKTDRTVLRRMAPLLALCAATIVAIVLTEVSSALGAPRNVQMTLLALVVVLAAAFIVWGLVSTSRQLWAAYRIGRTQPAKPQS